MNVKQYSIVTPDNSAKILWQSNGEEEEEIEDTEQALERKDVYKTSVEKQ